jgi:predicted MFS family arabinose efflux permease
MAIFFSAANEMVNLLFGVWLEDSFGLKIAALGAASVVVGLSEFGGESLTAGLVDRLGKERSIRWGLFLNCLCAVLLYYLGGNLWTALTGLFFFYITFEYAIVSCLPLISEIMPDARATILGLNISAYAIGRALGALVAPYLYQVGFGLNITAAVLLNLAAILVLRSVKIQANNDIG